MWTWPSRKVNDLYFGILYLDQQIRQVDILMQDLQREHRRIESCIANGVANLSDLDLIEVERITQEQNRESLAGVLSAGSDTDDRGQDR